MQGTDAIRVAETLEKLMRNAEISTTFQYLEGYGVFAVGRIFVEDEADNDDDYTFPMNVIDMAMDDLGEEQLEEVIKLAEKQLALIRSDDDVE